MSLIVVDKSSDKLVAHARLCPLPAEQQGCWVESVIVSRDLRGKGLGRWLMLQLEDEARKHGFMKVTVLCFGMSLGYCINQQIFSVVKVFRAFSVELSLLGRVKQQ